MDGMDLEISEESLAKVVDQVRTAEDSSAAALSRIVFATLVDQVGEAAAEKILAAYSGELANFIFQHEAVDIPDTFPADSLEKLKIELEEAAAQNMGVSPPVALEEQEVDELKV